MTGSKKRLVVRSIHRLSSSWRPRNWPRWRLFPVIWARRYTRSSCGCVTWLSFSSQEKHTTSLHTQLFNQIRAAKPLKTEDFQHGIKFEADP